MLFIQTVRRGFLLDRDEILAAGQQIRLVADREPGTPEKALVLDRGQDQDWFSSREIIAEAVIAGLGFYLFLVHLFTAKAPLIPLRIFRDLNFSGGLLMIFAVGMLVLATAALLAPYLQVLAGRSIVETGLLLAPRGAGTMIGVLLSGRLSNRVDPRWLMLFGILLIAGTLWEMTGWTPDVDAWSLTRNSRSGN